MEFVTIAHPDIEEPGKCPESALPHWESYGWRKVDRPPVPESTEDTAPSTSDTAPAVEDAVTKPAPRASRRTAQED